MIIDASYVLDAFLLIPGISMVLDLVVPVATLQTLRTRKARMLGGLALIAILLFRPWYHMPMVQCMKNSMNGEYGRSRQESGSL